MSLLPPVRIGLLGLGTVGGGTLAVLRRNATLIAARAGRRIEVVCDSNTVMTIHQPHSTATALN